MNRDEVRRRIVEVGVVPVVRATSAEAAMAAARAVADGGIPIVEVTMTVPGAVEVIAELARSMGHEVLLGAGTVLDAQTAAQCLAAGAQFLVSPLFDSETVALANREDKVVMPGALTPTEVRTAWRAGADFVKVFPCASVGGPAHVKALKAVFPEIPLVPTGGVNLTTVEAFLRAGAAALGVGSELVSGAPAEIAAAARRYVGLIRQFRGQEAVKELPGTRLP
jgi:2-dehydro-3-deoxyphosphogluconate aldolase/(4S)-4-hydroxy-2-oxoglutarate aldolase